MNATPSLFRVTLAVLSLLACGQLRSAEQESEFYIIHNAWSDPQECNLDTASPADFKDLWATDSHMGKCVRVQGVVRWRALFDSLDAYYLLGGSVWDGPEQLQSRRLGLYARDEVQQEFHEMERRKVEIAGIVDDCSSLRGPGVIMVLGYCHYTKGRILQVSQYRALPVEEMVLTDRLHRERVGNLVHYDEPTEFRRFTESRLREWIQMVQTYDWKSVKRAFGLDDSDTPQEPRSDLWKLFGSPAPLADRFKGAQDNEIVVMRVIERDQELAETQADDPTFDHAVGCVCLRASCANVWPIATVDADVTRTREYACLSVVREEGETRLEMRIDDRSY